MILLMMNSAFLHSKYCSLRARLSVFPDSSWACSGFYPYITVSLRLSSIIGGYWSLLKLDLKVPFSSCML